MGSRDSDATAEVVFQSPLRVVVESRFAYSLGGAGMPGSPRAVYRYVYEPFSPVVEVSAEMIRDDDEPWNELHFLHLSRDEFHYTAFVTGDPPGETPMQTPGEPSRAVSGRHWGVMTTDADAAGVGFSGATCWDASDEFVYYTAAFRGAWTTRTSSHFGGLYFGPAAADPAWYSRWLGPGREPEVRVLSDAGAPELALGAADQPLEGAHELRNDAMRIVFDGAEGGYDCLGIQNLATGGTRFVSPREDAPGLWQLELRTPYRKPENEGEDGQDTLLVDNHAAAQTAAQQQDTPEGKVLTLSWKSIDLGDEAGVLDVTASITLKPRNGPSEWRLQIDNRSTRFGLWEARYPYLATVAPRGSADVLAPRGNWGGTLYRSSKVSFNVPYPSGACPVQFTAFHLGRAGLYIGAHDGGARAKSIRVTGEQDVTIATYAEDMGVPGSDRAMPFPVVIAAYEGDWWQATRIYRKWALQQAWTAKGPIGARDDIPTRFTDLGLWFLGGGAPAEVRPWMMDAGERCDVPIGLHWYNWHQIPFDNSYPEYFPTKEGFADVVRDLTGRGQIMMPYINGRLWDQDIPSFAEKGLAGACKQPNGEPYTEIYGSGRRLAPMCPTTTVWQDTVNEICSRLIHECGVNGIYLDQIGAARPRICFDPSHGHPLGGGRHWVDSYRTMLDRAKAEAARNDVVLTTENTAEPYMDNIDGFLAWSPRFDNDVPLLPAVYSGYTVYFTSPQAASDDLRSFVMAQGRDFLWGCQLGWNHKWILEPQHRDKLEFELELCRMRLAAKDFMVFGTLLDEIRPTEPVPTVSGTWNRRTPHPATLPAVQGTLWRNAEGSLGVFMVNYDDEPRVFRYTLSPGEWLSDAGADEAWVVTRLAAGGRAPWQWVEGKDLLREEILAPHEIRAFAVTAAGKTAGRAGLVSDFDAASVAGDSTLAHAFLSFRFDAALARQGLSIDPPRPIQRIVRGEPAELEVAVSNRGGNAGTVGVTWPDGTDETVLVKPGSTVRAARSVWVSDPGDGTATIKPALNVPGLDEPLEFPVALQFVNTLDVRMGSLNGVRGGESFLLPIQVRNNSRAQRTAQLVLDVPAGWSVEPSPTAALGTLAPGGERSLLLKCTVPPMQSTQTVHLAARIVEHAAEAQVTVKKSRPRAEAVFLSAPAKIDGDLAEYADAPEIVLGADRPDTVKISKDYGGADDCQASVRLAWDKDNLYLAATVRDNALYQDESGFQIWRGDCIQLAFRNGPPNRDTGFDGSEHEVGLTLAPDGPLMFQWMPGERPVENGSLAVVRTAGRTVYESAIPWSALGITGARSGRRISWSMTVNDNDGDGFRGWLEWTPGVCGGKDSSAFGWLTLTAP
jgi:hypothetical protein